MIKLCTFFSFATSNHELFGYKGAYASESYYFIRKKNNIRVKEKLFDHIQVMNIITQTMSYIVVL